MNLGGIDKYQGQYLDKEKRKKPTEAEKIVKEADAAAYQRLGCDAADLE